MTDTTGARILFEHPLNERCRTLLRLSRLFSQFEKHLGREDPWSSRTALQAILDIAAILARPDIKSELIKELERHDTALSAMISNPNVDKDRLQQILDDISTLNSALKQTGSQLGNSLRKDEFLSGIAQRMSIPGGSFDFDLPQFHYWLHLPHSERAGQLVAWRDEVTIVQGAVELLLTLIRNSTTSQETLAEQGFYQQTLNSKSAIQMIQVQLMMQHQVYAEISGSKHRFCIRFMETSDLENPVQTKADIPFQLKICVI